MNSDFQRKVSEKIREMPQLEANVKLDSPRPFFPTLQAGVRFQRLNKIGGYKMPVYFMGQQGDIELMGQMEGDVRQRQGSRKGWVLAKDHSHRPYCYFLLGWDILRQSVFKNLSDRLNQAEFINRRT